MKKLDINSNNLSLLIIAILLTHAATAQTRKDSTASKNHINIWTSFGLQASHSKNIYMAMYNVGINCTIDKKYYMQLRQYSSYLMGEDFYAKPGPYHIERITNMAALVGIYKQLTRHIAIIPSAGTSYGEMIYRGRVLSRSWLSGGSTFDMKTIKYIGLQLETSIILTGKHIGTSLNFYANIHPHPDFGLSLNLLLGKMR